MWSLRYHISTYLAFDTRLGYLHGTLLDVLRENGTESLVGEDGDAALSLYPSGEPFGILRALCIKPIFWPFKAVLGVQQFLMHKCRLYRWQREAKYNNKPTSGEIQLFNKPRACNGEENGTSTYLAGEGKCFKDMVLLYGVISLDQEQLLGRDALKELASLQNQDEMLQELLRGHHNEDAILYLF